MTRSILIGIAVAVAAGTWNVLQGYCQYHAPLPMPCPYVPWVESDLECTLHCSSACGVRATCDCRDEPDASYEECLDRQTKACMNYCVGDKK